MEPVRAADDLGLSRVGLANKIKRYGLPKRLKSDVGSADEDEESAKAEIVRFPQSRVRPAGTLSLDLGPSPLAGASASRASRRRAIGAAAAAASGTAIFWR